MGASDDRMSAEDRLIADYFKPIATHPGALALTDDAAFVTPAPGTDVVLKTDAIIGGVHFFAEDDARDVARKALRVNLSDLAAKGATPLGFLVSLALPKDTSADWLKRFALGLREDAEAYACPLFGGDTDRTPGPVMVSISMFGSVPSGAMVRRAGARPGHRVFVTGTIGDAALGLVLRQGATWPLTAAQREHLLARYLLPQPRNALAEVVRAYASAAMDVSDGLAGDLTKLCRVSGVAAHIDVAAVPLSDAARAAIAADAAMRETALTGGDDFEVLCTVPPARADAFRAAARAAGVPVTDIGVVEAGAGAHFMDGGRELAFHRLSFSHF
ncbi:MAG TPA: thiamine-phosphate kinase [Pseudolabrys sp.]|uniref:thiamine-phosphate kinase n=1 Tax=Pseudolabrys sp. TaxID=1960880 RepID=UPI002DDD4A55|nr:thiamine-phosphate kinase [Pseudolabrys sp.]HEV2628546.1 thiamine-phosphate kinase [Pseudolabrys sp.]